MQSRHIANLVKEAAHEAGFELAGIAPVHEFDELDRFREWIDAGRAGEMHYMEARNESGSLKRASLHSTLPWVRSVVVCAINYNTAHPYSTEADDPQRGWIAPVRLGPAGLSRRGFEPASGRGKQAARCRQRIAIADSLLCRHRSAGRTRLRQVRRDSDGSGRTPASSIRN